MNTQTTESGYLGTKTISNAFSFNMLNLNHSHIIYVHPMTTEEAAKFVDADTDTAIGYESTASLVSAILGKEIKHNRKDIILQNQDTLLVAQYKGDRLPAGATSLPAGARLEFALAYVEQFSELRSQAVWRFEWRRCGLTGIFKATGEELQNIIGKTIHFEVQGKGDVSLELQPGHFTALTNEPLALTLFERYDLATGVNPLDHHKWQQADWEEEDKEGFNK